MLTIEQIRQRLLKVHKGSVILKEDTYVNITTKAVFIDIEYGEWSAKPYMVVNLKNRNPKRALVETAKKRMLTLEEIEKRVFIAHGDRVKNVAETYTKSKNKATFVDSIHGEWSATPYEVVRGRGHPSNSLTKIRQTNLSRYGVDHLSKDPKHALKIAKKLANTTIKNHWKTGEELVCQAGWEPKVVDYLNSNKINYIWQPKTFTLPNESTFRPDFFDQDRNVWVEIKGYMRSRSKIKWDWFKTQFTTAELWNKKVLIGLGIL